MKRAALRLDLLLATVITMLVLVVSPGAAVTAMVALLILLACAGSFIADARARRRDRRR